MSRIYVATSGANADYPRVLEALNRAGHTVFDFKRQQSSDAVFSWDDLGLGSHAWWRAETCRIALDHPRAQAAFTANFDALRSANAVILALPAGRSSHLELGWAIGAGKRNAVFVADPSASQRPELMSLLAETALIGWKELDQWAKRL